MRPRLTEFGSSARSLLLALLAFAGPIAAGEAQDRLFALGALDAVATGDRLLFDHVRSGAAVRPPALAPVEEGIVEVALRPSERGEGREAVVSLHDGAAARTLDPIDAAAGHPLMMVFMETSVRSMAAATGGSPFYIRNRMRDALRSQDQGAPVEIEVGGQAVAGTRYDFFPFAGDPNAARMGAFSGLRIAFVVSKEIPGGLARLETLAGPEDGGAAALRETMTFRKVEAAR